MLNRKNAKKYGAFTHDNRPSANSPFRRLLRGARRLLAHPLDTLRATGRKPGGAPRNDAAPGRTDVFPPTVRTPKLDELRQEPSFLEEVSQAMERQGYRKSDWFADVSLPFAAPSVPPAAPPIAPTAPELDSRSAPAFSATPEEKPSPAQEPSAVRSRTGADATRQKEEQERKKAHAEAYRMLHDSFNYEKDEEIIKRPGSLERSILTSLRDSKLEIKFDCFVHSAGKANTYERSFDAWRKNPEWLDDTETNLRLLDLLETRRINVVRREKNPYTDREEQSVLDAAQCDPSLEIVLSTIRPIQRTYGAGPINNFTRLAFFSKENNPASFEFNDCLFVTNYNDGSRFFHVEESRLREYFPTSAKAEYGMKKIRECLHKAINPYNNWKKG